MRGNQREDPRRARRSAFVGLATAVVSASGYLVLVYPPGLVEFPTALMAGLIAGTAAAALTAAAWPGWGRPSARVRTLRVAGQLLSGFAQAVVVALGRAPVQGRLAAVHQERIGRHEDPAAAADRALVGWARSLAADSYVVAFDEDAVREHRLGRAPA